MPQGPILIFDKSSLESLNLDEAVLLDNFYISNVTPLFFVECLADLEKSIRSRSTPEQLVGSLADRPPEAQSCANVHHIRILKGELSRLFDLKKVSFRPMLDYGKPVQLGDKKGILRAGYFVMPMDETLAVAAIDLSLGPLVRPGIPRRRAPNCKELA